MKYILNFGGGVNSAALYFVIKDNYMRIDDIVFADSGAELPRTYATVEKFRILAHEDGIPFTVVKSKYGDMYDYFYARRNVPSIRYRSCTSKFKKQPVSSFIHRKYGMKERFTHYIGISYEEAHRMVKSGNEKITYEYPLVDERIDRSKCEWILKQHGITDVAKSGCYFCPFSPKKAWLDLYDNHPDLFEKAIRLETNCKNPKMTLAKMSLTEMKKKMDAIKNGKVELEEIEHSCAIAGTCFR